MPEATSISVHDAQQTARLLDFPGLVAAIRDAARDYAGGAIEAPPRQAVRLGRDGIMLSMPAAAEDIALHKLVNIVPTNPARGLPTLNGLVAAYDGRTGQALFVLDGPTVTARRTAAVSMLGLQVFLERAPQRIAVIGTGTQASAHLQAIAALFPAAGVYVAGRSAASAAAFAQAHRPLALRFEYGTAAEIPDDAAAVITATTSKTPVYDAPAQAGRLVVGVGAFVADTAEVAAGTVRGSRVYVDDPAGARHEAGDIILAGIDWNQVGSLAQALAEGVDHARPLFFKSVGCAAWDLAAARCARNALGL